MFYRRKCVSVSRATAGMVKATIDAYVICVILLMQADSFSKLVIDITASSLQIWGRYSRDWMRTIFRNRNSCDELLMNTQ